MSVCIAGLYEDGKGAILVADKMLTFKPTANAPDGVKTLSVESDDIIKIRKVNKALAILTSGHYTFGQEILALASKRLEKVHGIKEASDILLKAYDEVRRQRAFYHILFPQAFDSYEDYQTKNIDPQFRSWLAMQLIGYSFDVDVLIVGKNSRGLYRVYTHGHGTMDLKRLGFDTIGSGSGYAMEILSSDYRRSMTRSEVATVLRRAKKKAEVMNDVGPQTKVVYLD